ncbi:UDP-glucose 4-epimerase GalE [Dyella nitratireducens]|uniref:UDP-glucose 4-epimerase n=1 Tax=Dyella nitratireducens TaxID=1849580 RepID=A0ABQ1GFQ9_9GAMM|nr:UDP-glucose 4-epimerase GalE [Dyella nitratireducens]GGA42771.1 UDP-glucose 4-epimerase GalE [Dyella nitratireducens]GLQ41959.1 UDP-glucose 4-epimerase GalE [Dyella nitratireducens]
MKVLVCGGAGYIGSHMVRCLLAHHHEPVVYDNLSTGHREAVADVPLIVGDIRDSETLRTVFDQHCFDAAIHLCAHSLVGESMNKPYEYYQNNVFGTLCLLEAMHEADVTKLVFSSTAAVFGHPLAPLIDEEHAARPINPYGASKWMVERILADAAPAYGLRSVSLRYFNAAGADPSGEIGESHHPETHLIPNILRSALGKGSALKIFGDDYPTKDGTCVRDYIHVNDLAEAHLRAIRFLDQHDGAHCFNLGSSSGFTVLEIIEAARRVTGMDISFERASRRAGDPPVLVASNVKARVQLGWRPAITNIDDIVRSAWLWHSQARY